MFTVKYFMWRYQHAFRGIVEISARNLLEFLGLEPTVNALLIGLLDDDDPHAVPIAVYPDDCEFQPDALGDLHADARHILDNHPDRDVFYSDPDHHERMIESRRRQSVAQAVQSQLEKLDWQERFDFFVSYPERVGHHLVFVVLKIDKRILARLPALHRRPEIRYSPRTRSLQHAAIYEFLIECSEGLLKPDAGVDFTVFRRGSPELLREAGTKLATVAAWAAGNQESHTTLFHSCNRIASLRYEGSESVGVIIISPRTHENLDVRMRFSNPAPFRNHRAVRKLLELTTQHFSLLSDTKQVWGLGRLRGKYEIQDENVFVLRFLQMHAWEMQHGDSILMKVINGDPLLAGRKLNTSKLESDLQRIFPSAGSHGAIEIRRVIEEAANQRHGAMVVISSDAADEAARLANQSFPIEPRPLDVELEIGSVTSIDGAILLDSFGTCYAIGVILDGIATAAGTPARGARYNSALRYVSSRPARSCLVAVMSEDGGVDLVPDLLEILSRSGIESKVNELRMVSELEEVLAVQHNPLFGWFDERRPYLKQSVCNTLNELFSTLQEKWNHDGWWVSGQPFREDAAYDEWFLTD
jgi:hypothetical protein